MNSSIRQCFSAILLGACCAVATGEPSSAQVAPASPLFEHFPSRMHAFVWRNWHVADAERLAGVLGTSVETVTAIAESMGLPPAIAIPPEQRVKGYFWMTVCRRNWHLLSEEQLSLLLDTNWESVKQFLQVEETANWTILGLEKPAVEPLRYEPPTAEQQERAAQIKRFVEQDFGDAIRQPGEPRFDFIKRLSQPSPSSKAAQPSDISPSETRIICSYLGVLGDSLMDSRIGIYPEGLLQRYANVGINGVWLYGVLHQLAPGGEAFPEFGKDSEQRLANLRTLVERAKKHGIGVYLYFNEPRAMPEVFFRNRPEMAGVREAFQTAMCTANPTVRKWMGDALAHVFNEVPDLAGIITISASENLTNCDSHKNKAGCPRCKDRSVADIITEVNAVIEEGVHRGNPEATVFAWDWGWPDSADDIVNRLPTSVTLLSVSEWSKPLNRGGVATSVNEYSLSAVGPGPRALNHWELARQRGMQTAAKVQLNTSWEMASIPYLPVMDLVAEHCHNLAAVGVDGMMLSWTLGGYPSPNLEIANDFTRTPVPTVAEVLDDVARRRFGPEGAPCAREAWTAFSTAFVEYPFHSAVLYLGPMQLGPSNLLYRHPTGLRSTMVGFAFDDVNSWGGPYPPHVFAEQMEKVAVGWEKGLPLLRMAVEKSPPERRREAEAEFRFARAAHLYFRSAANQTRFVLTRDALANTELPLPAEQRDKCLEKLRRIVSDELAVSREMYELARADSTIGYEAASQYFYLPLDLVEKVFSCRQLLDGYEAK